VFLQRLDSNNKHIKRHKSAGALHVVLARGRAVIKH